MTTSAPAAIALAMSPEFEDAAVRDHRNALAGQRLRRVVDRSDLRGSDAGDDAGGADRAGSLTHLHRVRSRVDERERALARGDVPRDQLDVVLGLEAADDVQHAVRVAVAVSTTRTSTSASTRAAARSSASLPTPTAAPTRRRPWSSFVASGYLIRLEMSLTVMSPLSRPSASTTGSFSILWR